MGTVVESESDWPGLFSCHGLEREAPALPVAPLQGDENVFSRPSPHPFSAAQGPFLFVSLL